MHPLQPVDLRDWLAGQALVGILGSPSTPRPEVAPFEQHAASIAEQAYSYADAMLRERLRTRPATGESGEPPESAQETPGSFGQQALMYEKVTGRAPGRQSFPDEIDPVEMPSRRRRRARREGAEP